MTAPAPGSQPNTRKGCMSGSSKLNPRQSDVYFKRFGLRYAHVQETPQRASRRLRRMSNGRPITDEHRVEFAIRQSMRYSTLEQREIAIARFWRKVKPNVQPNVVTKTLLRKAA